MSQLYAVIDPASPRYPNWIRDLGRDFLPVLPGGPVPRCFEGSDRLEPCYLIDREALDPEQLRGIVAMTALEYDVPFDEVLAEFVELGMPIEAEGLIVCTDPNEGRLRFPFWSGDGRKEVS